MTGYMRNIQTLAVVAFSVGRKIMLSVSAPPFHSPSMGPVSKNSQPIHEDLERKKNVAEKEKLGWLIAKGDVVIRG